MREMRAEGTTLRDKVDSNYGVLIARIDTINEKLGARIDTSNEKLSKLTDSVASIGSKLTALLWVFGGLGTLITLAITVGKAFHWF